MRRQRTLVTILALGILLVSPMAWGCEGTGMQNCSMSDCPMPDQPAAGGCHEPDGVSGDGPAHDGAPGCDPGPEVWIACCDAPVDQEPAKVDSASAWVHSTVPLIVLAERVEPQARSRPPDLISEAISSQQHELGRFTLLSSFLL